MGKSRTFKYVLTIETVTSRNGQSFSTPMEWKREYGKPTTQNLDKWVTDFEQSCLTGANKHLGLDPIVSATIRENSGPTVADWIRSRDRKEPMFQVVA